MQILGSVVSSREILQTLLATAITGLIGEIAFSLALARGVSPPLGYLVLCSGLTLSVALVLGTILGATIPRIPVALSVWAGVNAILCLRAMTSHIALVAVCIVFLTAIFSGWKHQPGFGAAMSLGVAFVSVVVLSPRAFYKLGTAQPSGIYRDLSIIGFFGGILLVFWVYGQAREKLPWLPSEMLFCCSLLILMTGGVFFLKQVARFGVTSPSGFQSVPFQSSRSDLPTILILVLDTVRADHLSVYGYARDTTPALRKFIEKHDRARVYPMAFSPGNWTLPGHASLFSGELPSTHGAHFDETGSDMLSVQNATFAVDRTLAEVMKSSGYRTAAVFANTLLSMSPGLERGFDLFEKPPEARKLFLTGESLRNIFSPSWYVAELKPYPSAGQINSRILQVLDTSGNKPWFIVANFMEAHTPYAARKPYDGVFSTSSHRRPVLGTLISDSNERLSSAENRYDEELLALDADLEHLFTELESRRILDTVWIVITSDHGEAFGEHGTVGHGSSVYNEEVRIPLIVVPPLGEKVPEVSDPVSLVDVASTIAAVAGENSFGIGSDLRLATPTLKPVQIEFYGGNEKRALDLGPLASIPARAVVMGDNKLIEYPDSRELFNLGNDLRESQNLEQAFPNRVSRLSKRLPPLTPGHLLNLQKNHPLTVEQQERLRALGYGN